MFRKRMRLRNFDYSGDHCYFVTINVKDKIRSFGMLRNGEVKLNRYGKIARDEWVKLESQFPYVILHDFIVMPNHIHGILEINSQSDRMKTIGEKINIRTLPILMAGFKAAVSREIHLFGQYRLRMATVVS